MPDTFNFSDVFISYSRKDIDFARRIFDRLKVENREVWADWEDIPATADWWAEVQAGIEGANTFVFIISPDSVMSEVCRREIDHAIHNNKRFVPVLYREVVEPEQKDRMHGAISSHNWIYFRDTDDFDTAFQRLIASLEMDLNHVRMHTRLLVRAREWDSRNRIPGFLLAGTELREGQSWLAESAAKSPPPTPLHGEYVNTSTRVRRRQQILQITLVVALVVALAFAILSFILSGEANRQATVARNNAETATLAQGQALFQAGTAQAASTTSASNALIAQNNAVAATIAQGEAINQASTAEFSSGISRSIALSAQSQLDLNGSAPERSLVLALNALKNFPYTVQAERSLGLAVLNNRVLYVFAGHTGAVNSAEFSPDGKELATAGDDRLVQIWDVASGKIVMTLSGHEDRVEDAVWSPDGRYIASASWDGNAILWDAKTGQQVLVFSGHTDRLKSAAFSPDSQYLVTTSYDNTARVWDVETGETVHVLAGHTDVVSDAAFSPDGKLIATASWDMTAIIWDAQTGEMIQPLVGDDSSPDKAGHTKPVNSIAFSPDGRRVITAGDDAKAIVWEVATGEPVGPPLGQRDRVLNARFSQDGRKLLTTSADGTLRIWIPIRTADGSPPTGFETALEFPASVVLNAAWSPDGNDVVTDGADGKVRLWDTTIGGQRLDVTDQSTAIAVFSPDGKWILGSVDAATTLWNATTGAKVQDFPQRGGDVLWVAWSADGSHFAAVQYNGFTWVGTPDGQYNGPLDSGGQGGTSNALALSNDGSQVAVGLTDGTVTVMDAASGNVLFRITKHTDSINSVMWSPDGKNILVSSDDGSVDLWDAQTGAYVDEVTNPDNLTPVNYATYSPDGERVALAYDDGTAAILELDGDDPPVILSGHTGPVAGVDWSPNGKRIITASRDRTAKVWDAETGSELFSLFAGQSGPLINADWSPDGTQVLTTSEDGHVSLWNVWQTLDDLLSYAQQCCYLVQLSPAEKAQFGLPAN